MLHCCEKSDFFVIQKKAKRTISGEFSVKTFVFEYYRTEKNATPWSKGRLKELLCGQKITKEFVHMRLDNEFKNLTGEATANNRKAKLIFFYEWDIDMGFKGFLYIFILVLSFLLKFIFTVMQSLRLSSNSCATPFLILLTSFVTIPLCQRDS